MTTVTKVFPEFPFAHRQHTHEGHCKRIHGHNWTFRITFSCQKPDENGFVIDFGSLGWLKAWLAERFDHTCVLSASDPIVKTIDTNLFLLTVIPSASCEGIASYLLTTLHTLIQEETKGRVSIAQVVVEEDSKNSAAVSFYK